MTLKYLTALGKNRATWQTFRDTPDCQDNPRILHGPLNALHATLKTLNDRGNGIFIMVNDGDLQGRRVENVKAVTAYFIDLDGKPLPESFPLPPTMIVQSSPGRYHAYWRVTGAPLASFPHVQKHLAVLFDGDPKVHDLPRVMRVPGFQHRKGEPFPTEILELREAAYSHEQVMDFFGVPAVPPPPPARRPMPRAVLDYIDQYGPKRKARTRDLDTAVERVVEAAEGNRNNTLYRVAAACAAQVKAGELSRADAETELQSAGESLGLDPREVKATIASAMRYA